MFLSMIRTKFDFDPKFDTFPKQPKQLFVEACESGKYSMAQEQIEIMNNNIGIEEGKKGLFAAARGNHVDILKLLLDHEVSLHTHCFGKTALHLAAKYGNSDAVCLLIRQGSFLNYRDERNLTPLHYAILGLEEFLSGRIQDYDLDKTVARYKEIIDYLFNEKSVDEYLSNSNGENLFHFAAYHGNLYVMGKLQNCSNEFVDSKTKFGETALHLAIRAGKVEVVKYLLDECSASVDLVNCAKESPLLIAINQYILSLEIIEILINNQANINLHDGEWNNALHLVLSKWDSLFAGYKDSFPGSKIIEWYHLLKTCSNQASAPLAVACYLIDDCKIEIHKKNRCKKTPLDVMGLYSDSETKWNSNPRFDDTKEFIHILITTDEPIDNFLLLKECFYGGVSKVKELLQKGADPNVKDKDGSYPLHNAAFGNHPNIIDDLIRYGAKINKRDSQLKYSPLHIAAFYANCEAVEILIKNGASCRTQTISGLSPLMSAINGYRMMKMDGKHTNDLDENFRRVCKLFFTSMTPSALHGLKDNEGMDVFELAELTDDTLVKSIFDFTNKKVTRNRLSVAPGLSYQKPFSPN